MKRFHALITVLAIVALSIAGCAPKPVTPGTPPTPSTPTVPATSSVTPTPSTEPTMEPASPAPTKERVSISVFFSYKEKMQAVQRYAPAGTVGVLKAAMNALLEGPTAAEKKAGLSSQIPAGTTLRGVNIKDGVAIVDLDSKYGSGGGSLSMFNRIAQVVFTATQFKSVTGVQFRIGGKTVEALGGEGVEIKGTQTRTKWEDQSPAILVESPAWGGVIRDGQAIRGSANVFEATFQLRLTDSNGVVLMNMPVTATSGTGLRGTWSVPAKLGSSDAKSGKLRVFVYSAKDGKPESIVEIPVILER